MILRILLEAETELDEAIAHYEAIEAGLGVRLKEEAKDAIAWISSNPESLATIAGE